MSSEVAVIESREVVITSEQTELIKKTICQGATDAEMKLFFYDCQRRGVHPLDKLIHFTKRKGKYVPITSIDFFRIRAHGSGAYAGEGATTYELGEDGLPNECTVAVLRFVQGHICTWRATARWNEYYPGEEQGFNWKKMPFLMLAKCAEALALRKAFPAELQGLYVKEEMDQAGPSSTKNFAEKFPEQAKKIQEKLNEGAAGVAPVSEGEDAQSANLGKVDASPAPSTEHINKGNQDPAPYLDRIAISQSVRECSETINQALADKALSVFDHTTIQEAGKRKIVELRKK